MKKKAIFKRKLKSVVAFTAAAIMTVTVSLFSANNANADDNTNDSVTMSKPAASTDECYNFVVWDEITYPDGITEKYKRNLASTEKKISVDKSTKEYIKDGTQYYVEALCTEGDILIDSGREDKTIPLTLTSAQSSVSGTVNGKDVDITFEYSTTEDYPGFNISDGWSDTNTYMIDMSVSSLGSSAEGYSIVSDTPLTFKLRESTALTSSGVKWKKVDNIKETTDNSGYAVLGDIDWSVSDNSGSYSIPTFEVFQGAFGRYVFSNDGDTTITYQSGIGNSDYSLKYTKYYKLSTNSYSMSDEKCEEFGIDGMNEEMTYSIYNPNNKYIGKIKIEYDENAGGENNLYAESYIIPFKYTVTDKADNYDISLELNHSDKEYSYFDVLSIVVKQTAEDKKTENNTTEKDTTEKDTTENLTESETTKSDSDNETDETTVINSTDSVATITDAKNVLPAGTTFSSVNITSGELYDNAKKVMDANISNATNYAFYEMNLNNAGVELHELNGIISVTMDLPIQVKNNGKINVYRVDDDKFVLCESSIIDGKITFKTNHFSTYVFVEEQQSVKVPDTGDASYGMIYVLFSMIISSVIVVIICKKRNPSYT